MTGLGTRAFVARLAGTAVFDPNGDQLGKVRDVVVMLRPGGFPPRVNGFVVEVPPHRRIFLPMTRIRGMGTREVIASGLVNLRRFAPRPGETLAVGELLDRKITLRQTDEAVTVLDIGIECTRGEDWVVTKLFVRKGGGFRRRGETLMIDWDQGEGLAADMPDQGVDALLSSLAELRPADVAAVLRDLSPKRQLEVARSLDDDRLADVLEELPDSDQVKVLGLLPDDRAADILEEMDPADAADLLSELTPDRAEELLRLLEPDDAEDLRRLLAYDEYSAGGMMTTEPVILGADATVAEALARVSNPRLAPSLAAAVYLTRPPLETPTGKFLGVVHFQGMLRELPSTLVSSLIDRDVKFVRPEAPLDDVVRYCATYNLVAVPVVGEAERLLGVVTIDDVIDHMLPGDWRERDGSDGNGAPDGTDQTNDGKTALIGGDGRG